MKTAVVCYSLDGNCAFVAAEIKNLLNADIIQLHTVDEKKRSKLGNFFWGGGMVFLRKKPELKPWIFDASKYDLIIMGVPVWAGSPAPPIQSFISKAGISGKKIALFVCHGGGQGKAIKVFKALLPGNDIVASMEFLEPINAGEDAKKQIAQWAGNLQKL